MSPGRGTKFVVAVALLAGLVKPVMAQFGKPRPPLTNVRSVCQELDADIPWAKNETLRLYGDLPERRKDGKSQKELAEAIEAFEKHAAQLEVTWQRLGCSAIIYGK